MKDKKKVRIGCASGFWGDTSTAAKQLVELGKLNYLVFDFLAEVTMSILARAKMKNPKLGYAKDFIDQLSPLLEKIKEDRIIVISNAGGINPLACRELLQSLIDEKELDLKIALVIGDDLISDIIDLKDQGIREIDTGKGLPESCLSINAYLGVPGILSALYEGADIIITGRCVDSALVLAPLMYEFNWDTTDYNHLASGSLAGHIIECGAQCTGGNFTDWKDIKDFDDIGFPIIEAQSNGDFIVSKPEGTGGMVTFGTVAEQFLYEIGNPAEYFLPDVVCDFRNVTINEIGINKVLVSGALGRPPTSQYKISATYLSGYRIVGTLVIGGEDSATKGSIIGKAIIKKVSRILDEKNLGPFTSTRYDLLGTDSIYQSNELSTHSKEIVLRLVATHPKKDALVIFSREIAQAVTGMTPGVINYLGGRPSAFPSINLYSFFLPKEKIKVKVDINNKVKDIKILTKTEHTLEEFENPPNTNLDIKNELERSVPLIKLAFARSGDKGDHANIGVIARKARYLPYIQNALSCDDIKQYFSHVIKGEVLMWNVPGINGINFLLKHSLGGGGMSSSLIDPQGKAFAQQLLEFQIPIDDELYREINLK